MLDSAIGLYPRKNLRESRRDLTGEKNRSQGRNARYDRATVPAPRRPWGGRSRCAWPLCSRRPSLVVVLDCTQARDILHVLIVGLSEGVSAGAIGHEIELLRARWIGGGLDGGATGIGNRPGRQSVDDIRVIGRRLSDLALGQRMAERAFAENETIDDGQIRLQLH